MTALLITACVAPNANQPYHQQFNAEERRNEYAKAFEFYASLGCFDTILFCENSDYDLSFVREIADGKPGKFLFHSYASTVEPERGKGRMEMELIDRAMEILSPHLADGEPVWKVTGRLIVPNMADLVATQPAGFDLYADFRSVPLVKFGGNNWVDMRSFAFSKAGHARFLQEKWPASWMVVEKWLFAEARPSVDGKTVVPRLRRQPLLQGVSGGTGANYDSLPYKLKTLARQIGRRVAPGLWI